MEHEMYEMAEGMLEMSEAVTGTVTILNEMIGDNTDTVMVPVEILKNIMELVTSQYDVAKSLYEFWAVAGDAIQKHQEEV